MPKLVTIQADLHIHTALSPCGGDEMTPPAIVAEALASDLQMIAICDHNCARNAAAVAQAAGDRLAVLAGMEITTTEEVHVVGLFPTASAARAASDQVCEGLPEVDDKYTAFFGEQWVLAADGTLVDHERHALATASRLDLAAAVDLIHRHGGLAVAAHVDRSSFGVLTQLGLFPTDAGLDAVETSRFLADDAPLLREIAAFGLPLTSSSDSHYLVDIGAARTALTMAEPTFAETALALAGRSGRAAARLPQREVRCDA